MAVTDHHDIFIGSTDDGWTFVVLNRPIRNAASILTGAGFTARKHQGRTVYLLPPETAPDAHERAGIAAYGLMAHTQDLVDLAWTTRQPAASAPAVTIRFADQTVYAITATNQADAILLQHGFTPARAQRQYELPAGLGERDVLSTVVRTEAHLHADGIGVRVDLGIASAQDIPLAPPRMRTTPAPPSTSQGQRRTR
ncbi:hypothetical protein [Streptomyces neyagawaensis]|uniref:hypothetical protein n=1 Tax=Streptomyces neyagawaensis TaxID=42238 RepID=UPI0006E17578|nr:hypothetical protein [Streptomyces neyagawaensis]MCL6737720.1 hypothetical protein [Streptomyces neyagawaensis]MDE1687710.1 hypothetical protein [Streptomyces neyagawaensis]MDG5808469.1 hypothetical protein [Streptomyces ossamyceticus]